MISGWIKLRVDLHTDPKVIEMARRLDYMTNSDPNYPVTLQRVTRHNWRHIVVGCLCQVWGVVRARGKRHDDDLVVSSATLQTLDDIVQLEGLGDALEHVGWVVQQELDGANSLVFNNFFSEYNTDPNDDHRAKATERKRKQRERDRSKNSHVTVSQPSHATVTPIGHTEKSREEKYIYDARKELLALGVPDDIVRDWLIIRGKKKLTKTSLDATTREAEKAGLSLEQAIRICCERGWVGFMAKYLQGDQQQQSSKGRSIWENQP